MAIVAGLDVHRAHLTFDALDTESGEVMRGRIDATPAGGARWAGRFAGRGGDVRGGAVPRGGLAGAGCACATPSRRRARGRIWPSRWRRARCGVASGAPRLIAR